MMNGGFSEEPHLKGCSVLVNCFRDGSVGQKYGRATRCVPEFQGQVRFEHHRSGLGSYGSVAPFRDTVLSRGVSSRKMQVDPERFEFRTKY